MCQYSWKYPLCLQHTKEFLQEWNEQVNSTHWSQGRKNWHPQKPQALTERTIKLTPGIGAASRDAKGSNNITNTITAV